MISATQIQELLENDGYPVMFESYDREAPLYSQICLLYTSPSPRDRQKSRMPSSA